MLSTTKARPNYYEMLGLSTKATGSEIATAFAREVSSFRPRPFGSAAGLSIAYATLSDPAKRRAYDASIGLKPEPEPAAPALTRVELKYQRPWAAAPFVAAPVLDNAQSSGVEGSASAPLSSARPSPASTSSSPPLPSIKEQVEAILARRSDPDFVPEPFLAKWSSPGLAIMALLLAAAAIGAFAGLKSVETVEPDQPAQAATVRLEPARPAAAKPLETPTVQPRKSAAGPDVRAMKRRVPAAAASQAPDEVQADSITESIRVVTSAPVEPAAGSAPGEPVAAAVLPVAHKDVARTIQRIGYACGSVDSAVPVEGAGQGVFKVTCTSGNTYRAAPIRGRYHFRRWGGR